MIQFSSEKCCNESNIPRNWLFRLSKTQPWKDWFLIARYLLCQLNSFPNECRWSVKLNGETVNRATVMFWLYWMLSNALSLSHLWRIINSALFNGPLNNLSFCVYIYICILHFVHQNGNVINVAYFTKFHPHLLINNTIYSYKLEIEEKNE